MSEKLMQSTKAAESSRVIAFESAEVVPGIVNGTFFLIVTGTAPCFNMTVKLVPLIYIRQPDYWGIEVVGTLAGGICLDAVKPYHVSLPLTGITGTRRIEVIGANQTEQFDVS